MCILNTHYCLSDVFYNHNVEKQMTIVENLKELKRMMTGVGQEGSEHSGGLECFSVQQVKLITDYIHRRSVNLSKCNFK